MDQQKPYLSFSFPLPGPGSLFFKKGILKGGALRRGRTLEERREGDLRLADARIHPAGSRFEPVDCGGVPCEWITREDSRPGRVILYIHGGSWSFGNLRTARSFGALLAEAAGTRVLTMEYRLAPEFPYPAALADCVTVFRWLTENGYPPGQIALFGDSAGGNLALALTHRRKSEGRGLPAAIGLASPVPDLTERSAIAKEKNDVIYTLYEGREWDAFTLYCGEHDREDPLISPVFGDLAGFPPMLIHVGGDEALSVDCDVFAGKAHGAGAEVSLKIWREMFHDFTIVGNTLRESRQSIQEFGEFFRSLPFGGAATPGGLAKTYEKARAFIYRNARPLDLARWRYHFEEGSRDAVLAALAAYQNRDGGFGHALEPDAWNPNSSPIQTWAATELLREVGFVDASHPVIQGILRYLAGGQDFEGRFWYNTVASNNGYPHAPWWHTESDSTSHNDYNPTACFAGFILRFADPDSGLCKLGRRIAGEAAEALLSGEENDMHTLACYIRLCQYCEEAGEEDILDLPAAKEKLRELVSACITRDTDKWKTGYICKPSQFFLSPDSPFYPGNEEIAAYECEFIAGTQREDGSWDIPWSWADYPEEWAVAKNWWRGDAAVKNMLYLKGMGRLG